MNRYFGGQRYNKNAKVPNKCLDICIFNKKCLYLQSKIVTMKNIVIAAGYATRLGSVCDLLLAIDKLRLDDDLLKRSKLGCISKKLK